MTNDAPKETRDFIKEKSIKYLVALGGGEKYKTEGIPHAWLVDSKGRVLWHGHPGNMGTEQIEQALGEVKSPPRLELPKDMTKVQAQADAGKCTQALKDLEVKIKYTKDEEAKGKLQAALDKLAAYGKSLLELADKRAGEGRYDDALALLERVEREFRGHDLASEAAKKKKELAADKATQLEMEAAKILVKAEALAQAGAYPAAAAEAAKVAKGKRYAETKMKVAAEKLLGDLDKQMKQK